MDFTNRFTVNAPGSLVWDFMLDAQEVAPCVPGAQITEIVDDTHFKGTVKIKLGAVQMQYRGELAMEPDQEARTITLRAKGTETRGSGGASGTFTTRLTDSADGGTDVEIQTHVDVTGRVAQFGRGIMQDVSNRLIKEFASCLEQKLQARAAGSAAPPASPSAEAPNTVAPRAEKTPTPTSGGDDPSGADASTTSSSQPPTVSPVAPAPQATPVSAELNMTGLLASVLRSRVAGGLRSLADRIEPK